MSGVAMDNPNWLTLDLEGDIQRRLKVLVSRERDPNQINIDLTSQLLMSSLESAIGELILEGYEIAQVQIVQKGGTTYNFAVTCRSKSGVQTLYIKIPIMMMFSEHEFYWHSKLVPREEYFLGEISTIIRETGEVRAGILIQTTQLVPVTNKDGGGVQFLNYLNVKVTGNENKAIKVPYIVSYVIPGQEYEDFDNDHEYKVDITNAVVSLLDDLYEKGILLTDFVPHKSLFFDPINKILTINDVASSALDVESELYQGLTTGEQISMNTGYGVTLLTARIKRMLDKMICQAEIDLEGTNIQRLVTMFNYFIAIIDINRYFPQIVYRSEQERFLIKSKSDLDQILSVFSLRIRKISLGASGGLSELLGEAGYADIDRKIADYKGTEPRLIIVDLLILISKLDRPTEKLRNLIELMWSSRPNSSEGKT